MHYILSNIERVAKTDIFFGLISLSLIAVTFKQFQGSNAFGAVELMILIVSLFAVIGGFRKRSVVNPSYLIGALVIFVMLMGGGVSSLIYNGSILNFRETSAYCFTFLIIISYILTLRNRQTTAMRVLAQLITAYLFIVLLLAWIPNPFMKWMWYANVKLQGLSNNPNQIAFIALIGLLLLWTEEGLTKPSFRTIVGASVCSLSGYFSESAAFLVAVYVGVCIIVLKSIVNLNFTKSTKYAPTSKFRYPASAVISILIIGSPFINDAITAIFNPAKKELTTQSPPLTAQSSPSTTQTSPLPAQSTPLTAQFPPMGGEQEVNVIAKNASKGTEIPGPNFLDTVISKSEQKISRFLQSDGGQGAVRFKLWYAAVPLIKNAPILGNGPGLHIKTDDMNAQEAHNTVLDILIISGVIGLLGFAYLIGLILVRAYSSRRIYEVFTILAPIFVFTSLHYTGRQPIFWVLLLLTLKLASSSRDYSDDVAIKNYLMTLQR